MKANDQTPIITTSHMLLLQRTRQTGRKTWLIMMALTFPVHPCVDPPVCVCVSDTLRLHQNKCPPLHQNMDPLHSADMEKLMILLQESYISNLGN